MYVRLSDKLKILLQEEEDLITWQRLKEKLNQIDAVVDKETLKGCEFLDNFQVDQISKSKTNSSPPISPKEYANLTGVSSSQMSTDIHQLRTELIELRRESAWLFNSIFSVVGLAVFVYFVTLFWFERVELRVVAAVLSALILFFLEVILFIIRS